MSKTENKKSPVKYLARLNSKNKNSNDPEQKKKSKKKRNWLFGVSALVLAGAGAGIAVGFTVNKATVLDPLSDSTVVYVIAGPNGAETKVTVGDVLAASKGFFNEDDGELAKARRELAMYLYEEEYEASKLFQKAWDSSKTENESSRTFQLDSLDEVRVKQKNVLEDKKRSFQKTFSVQNWENEWKKELAKGELGKSASDEQAIEFLTLQAIRSQAYARWIPTIDDSFTKYDIEERVTKEDIETTDKDGNNVVVFPKGERVFKEIINTKNTTTETNKINGFLPEVTGQSVISTTKVNAFITKSFVPSFTKTDALVQTYLDEFGYAFNVSELVINATQDQTNASLPWTISKTDLIELLTYKVLGFSQNQTALAVKQNIELIESFKGTQNTNQEGKEEDNLLLNSINPGTNSTNNLGAKPLRNIFEIFSEEDTSYANGYLEGTFKSLNKPSLFDEMLEKIRESLFKNTKNVIAPKSSTLVGKKGSEIEEVNITLQKEINKKSDSEISEFVGEAFRDLFQTSSQDNKVKTVYKIAENKFALLSSKGIHYVLMSKITTLDQFKKLINEQVQLKANEQFDKKQKPTTDVAKTFSFFNSEDQVLANQIKNVEVQKKLAEKILPNGTEEERTTLIENLVRQGNQVEVTFFTNKAIESFEKVDSYLKNVISNNLNSDFIFNETTQKITIFGNSSNDAAEKLLFNQLKNKGVK